MNDERYEIKGKIGQGGIGVVYRAFDRRLNRDIAIKRVLPDGGFENQDEAIEHLLKEAKTLSSVQHPHIVTVYDAGVDEEGPYVVMELLEGRTLDEMIERGLLTYEDFREVAIQTQEALIAAQDLNIVHRDLKPTNVMVIWLPSGKFQMKLVDFGLAKFSPKPSLQTINHGDTVLGSIHFMAPEQFERTPLDQRTDMYSMGCMYYFALTGLQPFSGETAPEVMASHLQHRLTPIAELRPDIPTWAGDWVMWHIEREMDKRPFNARESLHKFLMTEQQNPENPESPTPDQPKRPKLVFPGAENPPAAPIVAASSDPAGAPPPAPAATPPEEVPTAPQPIEPPEGQQPSIHTTSQVTASTPPAPEPVPVTPPPAPAPVEPAPVQAAPPAPVTPPATPAVPDADPATPPPAPATPPAAPAAPSAAPATPPTTPVQPAAAPVQPAAAPVQPAAAPVQPAAAPVHPPGQIKLTGATPPAAAVTPAPQGPVPGAPTGPSTFISGSTDVAGAKGISTAVKMTIAAVLVVAIIFVGIVVIGKSGQNKKTARLNALLAQVEDANAKDLPTTADDAEILLNAGISLNQTSKREAIYQRLLIAKSDGTDLDSFIAEYASNEDNKMSADIRIKLFQVIQGRRGASSLEHLIMHARNARLPETATAALKAAQKLATDKDVPALLKIIQFTSHEDVRQSAKHTVSSLAARSESRETLGDALMSAFENATTDRAKLVFIELLGSAGGDAAASIVENALKSKDTKTRLAGIAALGSWADDTEFESLLDYMADEENDTLRRRAFDSAFQFLMIDRERDDLDLEDMWKDLAREAQTREEKMQIFTGLANIIEDWAFAVVEFFVEDDDDKVNFRAEQALEHMEDRRERLKPDGKRDEDEDEDEPETETE
ncbi:MAG: protein kinase [Roseibacillus sp.]